MNARPHTHVYERTTTQTFPHEPKRTNANTHPNTPPCLTASALCSTASWICHPVSFTIGVPGSASPGPRGFGMDAIGSGVSS